MALFRIEYREPGTGETLTKEVEFEDTGEISAREWAEDHAYTLADKGPHVVTLMDGGDRMRYKVRQYSPGFVDIETEDPVEVDELSEVKDVPFIARWRRDNYIYLHLVEPDFPIMAIEKSNPSSQSEIKLILHSLRQADRYPPPTL